MVIERARDRHPAFDRNRNPDAVALRYLSDYVRELHGKVAKIDETALVTEHLVAMPLANHDAGIVLPANRYVAGLAATLVGHTAESPRVVPAALIPWAHRFDRNTPTAAGWLYMGRLFLRSPASHWRTVTQLGVGLVLTPVALVTLDDVLPLPDEASQASVERVALLLARRGHTDPSLPAIDITAFAAAADTAEAVYLADVANGVEANHFQTRDVWP